MSKVSRYDVGPGAASQTLSEDHHEPVIGPTIQPNKGEADGARANGEKERASIWGELNTPSMSLDVAIEAASEAKDIDAVWRVSLNEMRTRIYEIEQPAGVASLYGRDIAHDLLSFVTPSLRHPDMLRAERYSIVLERLVHKLAAAPADSMAGDGIVVLRQGLHWLALLRQNRNSLIEA
ncbi:hypothetical protein IVB15_06540 [Bradyrhizobium sp. 182]|uniref:hypothetical protein n=1 Tax=unclassified Bradyrhizobium TaxID=2631580 RepID=UPI001FF92468|nr:MULTISPECIES: hypothetical protein [unclassified Bradyrhizobium]MCK1527409.1 hypothetical protein [Bradyrhizobium sp. 182]MCK1618575.1 hypothetical protein [Bradyrhizobium sp. 159]MCK1758353.1 hypothetical protein [Bradyrhizobium sp. 137]